MTARWCGLGSTVASVDVERERDRSDADRRCRLQSSSSRHRPIDEELTGDDGTTILVFQRDANFPASSKQQQLTLFIRATKPGEDPLAGVSTRRLVGINFSN